MKCKWGGKGVWRNQFGQSVEELGGMVSFAYFGAQFVDDLAVGSLDFFFSYRTVR